MLYKIHCANTTKTLPCFSARLSSVAPKPITPILPKHEIKKECRDYSANKLYNSKQDRQHQYNVTLRRVRVTIVDVEKQ